jgi:ribosomal protein S3
MQIGIKGYSSRHRKMYKAKVGNYCLYRFNKENFKGLEIVVKGRLRGALRAGKEVLTDGTVSKNSLKTRLEYNELEVRSKTGILNVKVSLAKRI